jgi:hypothetical protein
LIRVVQLLSVLFLVLSFLQGRIQAFTQSPAVVEPQPGGAFSWFNGNITGTKCCCFCVQLVHEMLLQLPYDVIFSWVKLDITGKCTRLVFLSGMPFALQSAFTTATRILTLCPHKLRGVDAFKC